MARCTSPLHVRSVPLVWATALASLEATVPNIPCQWPRDPLPALVRALSGCPSVTRLAPAQAAQQRREAFLARFWPTSAAVGTTLGAINPGQCAADLRKAGRLLGAWSPSQRTYVHPDCQFGPSGDPLPAMQELLQILPSAGDDSGWRRTFWLYGKREALGGMAPANLLSHDPQRVIELARIEFEPKCGALNSKPPVSEHPE